MALDSAGSAKKATSSASAKGPRQSGSPRSPRRACGWTKPSSRSPSSALLEEGSPTKIDYREKKNKKNFFCFKQHTKKSGTLSLTSLLEDLVSHHGKIDHG